MSFEDRRRSHDLFVEKVKIKFKEMNFAVMEYGQESHLPKEFMNLLYQCKNDMTAKYLRYKPDLALIAIRYKKAILCEVKSSNSGFIEKNSYEIGLLLSKIGINTMMIFPDWSNDLIKNLEWDIMYVPKRFANEIDDYRKKYPDKEIGLKENSVYGSNTPYIKIKKEKLKKDLSWLK